MEKSVSQQALKQITANDLEQSSLWLRQFVDIYQQLSTDNLVLLEQLYHQNIVFIDPMHKLEGLTDLTAYFTNLYQNLLSCQFTINNVFEADGQAAIYWTMNYQHRALKQGQMITVQGHSHIKGAGDKVIYHRDYIDLGAMFYEHLPLIGRIIKWLKARAVKS